MVSVSPSRLRDVKYFGWALYEDVSLTTGDTIPLDDFVTTEPLKKVVINNNLTGAEVTCTYGVNNVVTVTGAISDQKCTIYAYGVRAT